MTGRKCVISSLGVVVCYVTFATIAWARFPLPYLPIHNWLSDLGNPQASPAGAIFYNAGIVITAGLLLAFFLGLSRFRLEDSRVQTLMTILTVLSGSIASFGLLMSAVYPIHRPAAHSFWCMVLYISIGTAFAFSIAAFRYHSRYPRWLLGFGAVVALVNLGVSAFFHDVFISEWVNVPLLLSYCLLLGIATQRLCEKTLKSSSDPASQAKQTNLGEPS
jgi:hypothetical membrane protein